MWVVDEAKWVYGVFSERVCSNGFISQYREGWVFSICFKCQGDRRQFCSINCVMLEM